MGLGKTLQSISIIAYMRDFQKVGWVKYFSRMPAIVGMLDPDLHRSTWIAVADGSRIEC